MENKRSKNDEMSQRVWKAVEIKARKVIMAKAKERRGEGGEGEEMKREKAKGERKEEE